ncbi:hypothetical protein O6P43_032192 [Quillaja saponaria]|uniref:Uncharacterized protein n=1 Tax=Quillaja saponaria TaxID=32244 RepID=A0AAD7KYP7_QUISA|nr:hypothetical protein O6P43_032192 [Quillaja saponaria]
MFDSNRVRKRTRGGQGRLATRFGNDTLQIYLLTYPTKRGVVESSSERGLHGGSIELHLIFWNHSSTQNSLKVHLLRTEARVGAVWGVSISE